MAVILNRITANKILIGFNFDEKTKRIFLFQLWTTKDPSEDFNNILVEIIDDVVKKRKALHDKYDQLFEMLWVSEKNINERKFIAKRLLSRLLRESDLIFIRAQNLATRLCPKCEEVNVRVPVESKKLH